MHNPAAVLENDTHKLLWDLDIQTDHPISARRPDLMVINKKKKRICKIVNFAVPEYWEESWRLEETCYHLNSSERPSANAVVKNSNE